ncbi:MAG: hypothetical protein KC910_01410 [Candidatus Eremiobacteraeota bacterium]|nr:hypothetical protein [Candidatus Eremiobacteraeota bacterium]
MRMRLLLVGLTVLAALMVPAGQVQAQGGLQGFFAGTSADGGIFLAQSHQDLSGSMLIKLAGVTIPGRALSSFNKYCSSVLGGHLLMIKVYERQNDVKFMPSYTGVVTIITGGKQINFNKQALVDGYGMLRRQDARFSSWEKYESKGRERKVGIWAVGAPHWPVPKIPHAAPESTAQGTDRDRIIAQHGLPDHTNRTTIPDNYSIISYHLYITDFYLREGLVFIYRDGKLVNKQPYVER